ncbi:hypothetical protein PG999_000016 [Apiospora kogelbergensis]|uniref:AB hydrolase-1 domain-containing protein n=1 Tax=Apiospora kogelbergensis TaxID=1337665 RepID=A0AAW0RAM4_9PEZI
MSNSPTLVLIPGAWHKPACYDQIIDLLQGTHKLRCVAVTLPTTFGNRDATFKNDIDVVREAISKETSQGRDVVVVCHSYGGMVGNSAIKGLTKPRDPVVKSSGNKNKPSQPSKGYVVGHVLIASGFTMTGLAFMDLFLGHPPPFWRINNETGFAEFTADLRQLFYHDLPRDEGEYWVSQITPQTLKSLFEGGEFAYAGWQDVPVWYLGTIDDQANPVAAQRINVGFAREMGAHVEHRELPASHSPFLSLPEETVQILVDAVEAFTGHQVAAARSEVRRARNKESLPAVRLWQPLTWYKYGLPYGFGRLVGRGIMIFRWCKSLWRSG